MELVHRAVRTSKDGEGQPVGTRDYQGFSNPQGSWVGYIGVRVRVGIFIPFANPYPWEGSRVFIKTKIFK